MNHARDPIKLISGSIHSRSETRTGFSTRPSSMAEHPAVAYAHSGVGFQALSRHRRVPGSTPGGGTNHISTGSHTDSSGSRLMDPLFGGGARPSAAVIPVSIP